MNTVTVMEVGLVMLVVLHLLSDRQLVGGAPQSFQPQDDVIVCPGDPVTFTCTVIDEPPLNETTIWRASGGVNCDGAAVHSVTRSAICLVSITTFFNINGVVQDDCIVFSFTTNMAGATPSMNETLFECHSGVGQDMDTLVGNSTLFVAGPPSSPGGMSVRFTEERQEFIIQWSRETVASLVNIDGYNVQVDGPNNLCGDPNTTHFVTTEQYVCSNWSSSSFGQTYTFMVSAVNCGNQLGSSSQPVTVTLQVPDAPSFSVIPLYDQLTGRLLIIQTNSSTVDGMTIAIGVDGSPDAYIFSYSDDSPSVILPSENCTNGTCTDIKLISPDTNRTEYTVSVAARNVVGVGPSSTSEAISVTNDILSVVITANRLECRFMGDFTGTAECHIVYGTDASYSNLPFRDTGSSTNGDTVMVTLTSMLMEEFTTYYYIVTATYGPLSVSVRGLFQPACSCTDLTNLAEDECEDSINGGILNITDGRVIYTGRLLGSGRAVYKCDEGYELDGSDSRSCLLDATWSGSRPVCKYRSLYTALLAITGAIILVISSYVASVGLTFFLYPWNECESDGWRVAAIMAVWVLGAITVVVALAFIFIMAIFLLWRATKQESFRTFGFMSSWWKAGAIVAGDFLLIITTIIWIVYAVTDRASEPVNDNGLLTAGFIITVFTLGYWVSVVIILFRSKSIVQKWWTAGMIMWSTLLLTTAIILIAVSIVIAALDESRTAAVGIAPALSSLASFLIGLAVSGAASLYYHRTSPETRLQRSIERTSTDRVRRKVEVPNKEGGSDEEDYEGMQSNPMYEEIKGRNSMAAAHVTVIENIAYGSHAL